MKVVYVSSHSIKRQCHVLGQDGSVQDIQYLSQNIEISTMPSVLLGLAVKVSPSLEAMARAEI